MLEVEKIDNEFVKKDNHKEKIKVGPSESMSKSKKNTIDPENIISNYGADAARLFILSDSPPEKDIQWSDTGISASYKFLQKLWVLNEKIISNKKESFTEDKNKIKHKISLTFNHVEDSIYNFEDFFMNGKHLIINLKPKNYWPKAQITFVIITMQSVMAIIKHYIWL